MLAYTQRDPDFDEPITVCYAHLFFPSSVNQWISGNYAQDFERIPLPLVSRNGGVEMDYPWKETVRKYYIHPCEMIKLPLNVQLGEHIESCNNFLIACICE